MKMNESVNLANIRMLQFVATKLGPLCGEVVFLGGCTTALFITDIASPDVRYTLDVDCIVDVISLNYYNQFEKSLLKRGFKKSLQDEIICRWHYDDVILDVMPTDEKILGFSNYWYKDAIKNSVQYEFADGQQINLVTAPYFLATKLEAFKSRGKMNYLASHDFEDIVSIIDGRLELVEEIKQSDPAVKQYLASSFQTIDKSRDFHDALPGHLIQYSSLSDARIEILANKIKQIVDCGV